MTTHVSDTFTRTHASSWGTADTGGAWTTEAKTDIVYSTDGSAAKRTNNSGVGTTTYVRVGSTGAGNREIKFRIKCSTLSGGTEDRELRVSLRRSGGTDYAPSGILAEFFFASSVDDNHFYFSQMSLGSGGAFGTAMMTTDAGAADQYVWCRMQIQGHSPIRCRGKMWNDGSPEPSLWHNATYSGGVAGTEQTSDIGVEEAFLMGMWEGGDPGDFTIDDLTVTSIDTDIAEVQSAISVGSPVTFPTTASLNSLLLVSIARNDDTSIATPSGWTQIGTTSCNSNRGLAMFSKLSDGTEAEVGYTGSYTHAFVEMTELFPEVISTAYATDVENTTYDAGGDLATLGNQQVLIIGAEIAATTSTGVAPDSGTSELMESLNVGSVEPLHWVAYKVVANPSSTEKVSGVGPNAKHSGHAYAYGKVKPILIHLIGSTM